MEHRFHPNAAESYGKSRKKQISVVLYGTHPCKRIGVCQQGFLHSITHLMELVINTFGTSLNRDNEGFVISTADGRQRVPAEGITSIQISKGAQITSDAVMLAVEREIEVTFMDRSGNVIGRIWSPKYGSVSTIRKGQLNFSLSHDAIDWIKEVIRRKIENQQALILAMNAPDAPTENRVQTVIRRLEDYRAKIAAIDGEVISDIAPQKLIGFGSTS